VVVNVHRRRIQGAGDQFELTGALQHVEAHQSAWDRGPKGQQAMIEQHDAAAMCTSSTEGLAFFFGRRHTVRVIGDVVQHMQRVLADRAKPLL
jgi:hypothetical protein